MSAVGIVGKWGDLRVVRAVLRMRLVVVGVCLRCIAVRMVSELRQAVGADHIVTRI